MEIDNKLKFFESSILSAVTEKKNEIESQMKEHKKEELEEFENKILEEAFVKMQEKVSALNEETRLELEEIEERYREKLFSLAENYYGRIFLEVSSKLDDYTNTKEYEKKLLDDIKSLDGVKEIRLSSKDKGLFDKIQRETKAKVIADDEAVLIGGFVAAFLDGGVLDKSISTAFLNERKRFLSKNNLIKKEMD